MGISTGKWSDQYKDPRWQKKRLEIMERDGFACRSCGANDKILNVHHAYYEKGKKPWEYPSDVLITWCEDCHKKAHETIKNIQCSLVQLPGFKLKMFSDLIDTCGISAAVSTLSNAYCPEMTNIIPTNVQKRIDQAMRTQSEGFMVLFGAMDYTVILKALIDANADHGFLDSNKIADAITMLAQCYSDGFADRLESEEANKK